MRVWISLLFAGAVAALSPVPASAQQDQFIVGNWEGWASYDTSGAFAHCAVSAEYQNGITLTFGMTPDFGLVLILSAPHWQIQDGSQFSLDLSVDRRWNRTVNAVAYEGASVIVTLADDYAAFDAMRRGRTFTVRAPRETFQFNLIDSSRALLETAKCVFAHTDVASRSDPFSMRSDPFSSGGPAGGQDASEVQENGVAALLLVSGLESAVLLTPIERQSLFPNATHAWQVGPVYGIYVDAPREGRSPEAIVAAEVALLAQGCTGIFASGTKPGEEIGDVTIRRFFTICEGADESFATYGTIFVGPTDLGLIEHVGSVVDRNLVSDTDDRLAAGLASVLRY